MQTVGLTFWAVLVMVYGRNVEAMILFLQRKRLAEYDTGQSYREHAFGFAKGVNRYAWKGPEMIEITGPGLDLGLGFVLPRVDAIFDCVHGHGLPFSNS